MRIRATMLLGLLFALPALRTWSAGGIELDVLAVRVAAACVAAYVAVVIVALVVDAYRQPEVEPTTEGDGTDRESGDASGDDVVDDAAAVDHAPGPPPG